jgi:SAM-dependent methyltransferase
MPRAAGSPACDRGSDDVSTLGEIQRGLRFANWLLNPLYRPTVPSVYDLIGTDAPTTNGLYLNLGFWRDARTLDDACEALVDLVGVRAQLDQAVRLVDCGFGFGDQDLYWARQHPSLQIVGLNVTGSQVRTARDRVASAGLTDRIDLRIGSATEMPLDDESADAVIALESAFHFRTRERFLREAQRVLKPGGRLVTADIIPMPNKDGSRITAPASLGWRLTASRFSIPDENVYPRADYKALLNRLGFGDVVVESIRDDVYPPLHQHLRDNPDILTSLHPVPRIAAHLSLLPSAERTFGGLDYVIGSAVKAGTVANA